MTIPISLEMIDYATLGLIMQMKMRHNLCWIVPIRDKFSTLFKNVVLGSLKFPLNWTIKFTLASATLGT